MCQSPAIREQLISELQTCFGDRIKLINRMARGKGGNVKDYAFSMGSHVHRNNKVGYEFLGDCKALLSIPLY